MVQPEQMLLPEPPPIAPIPLSAVRLPQGVFSVRLSPGNGAARFEALPISVAAPEDGAVAEALEVRLEVLAPELAAQLSPAGVAFTLAISGTAEAAQRARAGVGALQLTLDYGQINLPTYGGSFDERLTLYRGLGCQPDGAAMTCRAFLALPGQNDVLNGRLTVSLDAQALLAQLQPKVEVPAQDELSAESKEGSVPHPGVVQHDRALRGCVRLAGQLSRYAGRSNLRRHGHVQPE